MKLKVSSPSFCKNDFLVKELKKYFSNITLNDTGKYFKDEELLKFIKDSEALIIGTDKISDEILSECKNLKFISKYGVGLDNIDLEACKKRDVSIGWSGGVNRLSVAELTLGCMLMLCRNLYTSSNDLKNLYWNKNGGFNLSSKTIGIIGCGFIGKELVRLLKPFSCKILVNDIKEQRDYYKKEGLILSSKEDIYKNSDIISLHIPLDESTDNLISEKEFLLMKKTSYLINTSRGGIVNEKALKEALKSFIIAGAAIDVYETEPPFDKELLSIPNLITTPHIGGNSKESVEAMGLSAIKHLREYFFLMKEYDIRPKDVFEEYINLCKEDAISYFSKVKKYFTNCPSCDSKELKQAFVKYSFSYYECIECKTLFVNPMPEEEAFIKYYKNSKSAKFWASDFYKKTEKARIKNLVKPKVLLCLDLLVRYSNNLECVVDIGAGYGSFLQEFSKKSKLKTLAIEPSLDLSEVIKSKGLNVISKFLENVKSEDLPNLRKCFFSFELFEHLSRPKKFISSLYSIMKKGDLFIFTTLSSMGIDIRLLWENSKSIFPPHHINFFNPKSISFFLSNLGFEILNISTPGKLDIDILLNNKDYIDDGGGKFFMNFLEYSNSSEIIEMQKFISSSLLSSHMMIVCKKI